MEKILSLFAAAAMLAACSGGEECTVKGSVPEGVTSVNCSGVNGSATKEYPVENGKFSFTCARSVETPVSISLGKRTEPVLIIPDSKSIALKITEKGASVKGSKLSEQSLALQKWAVKLYTATSGDMEKMFEAGDSKAAADIMNKRDKDIVAHCRPIFNAHKNDYLGVQALVMMINKVDSKEFVSMYESASEAVKQDFRLSGYYNNLK